MAATIYTFGTFNLNDNVNYFLLSKDSHSIVSIAETLFKVGRLEGMKKTGQVTNERTIIMQVRVLGTSRIDLENKIDALLQALALQQQQLMLHANDSRFYIADCVEAHIPLGPGNVVTTVATLKFVCQQPYALAATASTFDTGTTTLTLVSGTTYNFPSNIVFAGGGNIYNRPTIRLIAKNTVTWTQVQVQQLSDSQFFFVTSNLPAATNDFIDIICDPYAQNGSLVFKNGNNTSLCQVSGIFPVLEPTSTNWQILVTVSSGVPQVDAVFTYTSRWLG